jgi:PAS domain S-box-containing protein
MILDVSPRCEELTGISSEEMASGGWARIVHPDDLPQAIQEWNTSVRTSSPYDSEYRVLVREGVWRWMRSRAAPRRDDQGKIVRWYGTVEDIHDHKQAEEALRRSEARLQAVFDAVPFGIVIAEAPDGNVIMSNPRAEDLLRSVGTPSPMIDDYCRASDFNPPGDSNYGIGYPLANAIMNGKTVGPKEYLRHRSDGTSTWISLTAVPVLGDDGKVSGGVVAIQDIDEEKRKMQSLSDLNLVLQTKIETR